MTAPAGELRRQTENDLRQRIEIALRAIGAIVPGPMKAVRITDLSPKAGA